MMTTFFTSVQRYIRGARGRYFLFSGILAVFFFVYAYLAIAAPSGFFNSPDEMANHFFSVRFADARALWYEEPLNIVAEDRVHPRATISIGGLVLPVSFLGLPLFYGALGMAFGTAAIPFITPLGATLASLAWYALCRRIFDETVARLAALLLLVSPAWWYYATRGMFHNVLFVALVLGALYLFARSVEARSRSAATYIFLIGAAVLLCGALFVRTVEGLWLIPLLIFGLYRYRHNVGAKGTGTIILILLASVTFFASLNHTLYGAPFPGYRFVPETAAPPSLEGANFFAALVPSGLHPLRAVKNTMTHFFILAWWITLPAIYGAAALLYHRRRALHARVYLWVTLVIAFVLFLWYGSWGLRDALGGGTFSLANSYVRYWLPATVAVTPFAAYGIVRALASINVRYRPLGATIVALLIVGLSAWRVVPGPDGVRAIAGRLKEHARIAFKVATIAPHDAVIISDRHDKIFFPMRRVMFPLRDVGTLRSARLLQSHVPLYYYGSSGGRISPDVELQLLASFGENALYRLLFL